MKLNHTLIVFDLETTGIWVEKDKIIEIAMIKCAPNGHKEEYEKRINPGMPIPKIVSELTGISDVDVKDAPAFKDVAQEILDFIGDAEFGGFNVDRFDLPLLERELYEAGHKFNWKQRNTYDAQKVYHLNEKRDLSAAYEFYCNKSLDNAHTALADTQATFDILKAQVAKYGNGDDTIGALKLFDYEKRGNFYDDEGKFRWWNGKLYMMFGKYARKNSLQEVAKKDRKYLQWIAS